MASPSVLICKAPICRGLEAENSLCLGLFGLRPTSFPGRHEVLRFGLMVERGLCEAATSIREGSAA